MDEIIHFATSYRTACGVHIIGSTVVIQFDELVDRKVITGEGYNIQHTSDPEDVTCEKCKTTDLFKGALNEG